MIVSLRMFLAEVSCVPPRENLQGWACACHRFARIVQSMRKGYMTVGWRREQIFAIYIITMNVINLRDASAMSGRTHDFPKTCARLIFQNVVSLP